MRRPGLDRRLRQDQQYRLSPDEGADARPLHLPVAGDLAGAAPADEPEAQDHRRARAGQRDRAGPAAGIRPADHEQLADPAR